LTTIERFLWVFVVIFFLFVVSVVLSG